MMTEGMLHNLVPSYLVDVEGREMMPVGAIPLKGNLKLRGGGGIGGVLHAHSLTVGLTGQHRVGEQFWVLVPGQKKGN